MLLTRREHEKIVLAVASVIFVIPLILTLGCGEEEAETIKIGCVMELSGELAPMGDNMIKAARMAVEEINEAGGVLGKQVELLEEDGGTNPDQGFDRVKKLVEIDGVQVIVSVQ